MYSSKGQEMSKRNFGVFNFPKNYENIFRISALVSITGLNKKIEAPYYDC